MDIKWAPLNVSWNRRLEFLGALFFISIVLFGEAISVGIIAYFVITGGLFLRTITIIYGIFLLKDRNAVNNADRGQGSTWIRNWPIWKLFIKYFPIKLVKTAELPPTRNYIFAVFPHGVISIGAFGNFATNATTFKKEFPGIRSKLCTLNYHFFVPIFREITLGWGMNSATEKSVKSILAKPNDPSNHYNSDGYTSNACVLMVGGAQEALNSRPGDYHLVLKRRKGFIRIALETGTPIVPVFSFGEVDIFDQPQNPPGSLLRKFQETVKKITGVAPALFCGRGFFQYSFGIIPRRTPVTVVVGHPIEIPLTKDPSKEIIQKWHDQFCDELRALFDTHKNKYIKNSVGVILKIE